MLTPMLKAPWTCLPPVNSHSHPCAGGTDAHHLSNIYCSPGTVDVNILLIQPAPPLPNCYLTTSLHLSLHLRYQLCCAYPLGSKLATQSRICICLEIGRAHV